MVLIVSFPDLKNDRRKRRSENINKRLENDKSGSLVSVVAGVAGVALLVCFATSVFIKSKRITK